MATLDEVTGWLNDKTAALSDLDKSILIDTRGDGFIHVTREGATNEEKPADLVVRISLADMEELGDGKLDPVRAMFTGRVKVSNMGLAMKLQPILKTLFS